MLKTQFHIGTNLDISALIPKNDKRCALIFDKNLSSFALAVQTALLNDGRDIHLFPCPGGEHTKNRETKALLEDALLANDFNRETIIIGMGGGSLLDLAGFIAATYCRGVSLVFCPTTTLAMFDASIGGKNAVNTAYGKNLIGSFFLPDRVIMDTTWLSTLPQNIYIDGFAELVKHACLYDAALFHYLCENAASLVGRDSSCLAFVLDKSYRIKNALIGNDIEDADQRQLLNFGHTVGHALEKVSNYKLSHGEAVSLGILSEAHLSAQMNLLSTDSLSTIKRALDQLGLPTHYQGPTLCIESIWRCMLRDKKNRSQHPYFVLINEIGKPYRDTNSGFTHPIEDKDSILSALAYINAR